MGGKREVRHSHGGRREAGIIDYFRAGNGIDDDSALEYFTIP